MRRCRPSLGTRANYGTACARRVVTRRWIVRDVLCLAEWVAHLRFAMQHPAFSRQTPDGYDRDQVPDHRLLKRAPRHLGAQKYVRPKLSRWRCQLKRRELWRRKKIGKVIEKDDITRFELKQQLETRICLDRNSSRLRTQKPQTVVHGSTLEGENCSSIIAHASGILCHPLGPFLASRGSLQAVESECRSALCRRVEVIENRTTALRCTKHAFRRQYLG
jgi:hypothetical protein